MLNLAEFGSLEVIVFLFDIYFLLLKHSKGSNEILRYFVGKAFEAFGAHGSVKLQSKQITGLINSFPRPPTTMNYLQQ